MPRPSDYSDDLAEVICERLIEGQSMRQVCEADDMPSRSTVLRWMSANEAFATRCAHARALQADLMDDLILETARDCTADTATADRVKIAAYQWRASKLAPKKYGDKVALVGGGPGDDPIRHQLDVTKLTDEQLAALEGILGATAQPGAGEGGEGPPGG